MYVIPCVYTRVQFLQVVFSPQYSVRGKLFAVVSNLEHAIIYKHARQLPAEKNYLRKCLLQNYFRNYYEAIFERHSAL